MNTSEVIPTSSETAKGSRLIGAGIGILAMEGAALKFGIAEIDTSIKLSVAGTTALASVAAIETGAMHLISELRNRLRHHG